MLPMAVSIYPFNNKYNVINFGNQKISSITIDAHKMLPGTLWHRSFLFAKVD
jgi:glutamate/tyrosine decarboxylase-like PLP-dependent enzyme